jgi:hypothetical protein
MNVFEWEDINFGSESSYDEITYKNIEKTIDKIAREFAKDFHFYILGGAPFSIYEKNDNINDIDLFFPNINEMMRFYYLIKKYYYQNIKETQYAYTFYFDQTKIQIIKVRFGTIDKIMNTFDLNKSRIGYEIKDNSMRFVTGKDFEKELFIDFDNFKTDTIIRYFKYLDKLDLSNEKRAEYAIHISKVILNYLAKNKDKVWKIYYGDAKTVKDIYDITKDLFQNYSSMVMRRLGYESKHKEFFNIFENIFGTIFVYKWFKKQINENEDFILNFDTENYPIINIIEKNYDKVPEYYFKNYPELFI